MPVWSPTGVCSLKPARWRGNSPVPVTPPAPDLSPHLLSATIDATGLTVTLVFDEEVTYGIDGNGGFSLDNGSVIATTYVSGNNSDTILYGLDTTVEDGDTVTLDYIQPGLGWKSLSTDTNLDSITDFPVTNNSEVAPSGDFFYFRPGGVDTYLRPGGVDTYIRP